MPLKSKMPWHRQGILFYEREYTIVQSFVKRNF